MLEYIVKMLTIVTPMHEFHRFHIMQRVSDGFTVDWQRFSHIKLYRMQITIDIGRNIPENALVHPTLMVDFQVSSIRTKCSRHTIDRFFNDTPTNLTHHYTFR